MLKIAGRSYATARRGARRSAEMAALRAARLLQQHTCQRVHAQNKIAGRIIPFLVLGFWDKNTVICAGAIPFCRDFPATTMM